MSYPRWKPVRELGLEPESLYPELKADVCDEDVDEEYKGQSSFVAGDYRGPRPPKRGTAPVDHRPKRAWAEPGGAMERCLQDLAVPEWCAQILRDSLRSYVIGARKLDRRADAEWGDVAREWLIGGDNTY